MVKNLLRIVHSIIIVGLIIKIITHEMCTPLLFGVEVGLTLVRAVAERRIMSRNTRVQIVASMVLGYMLFPNKARLLSWIFLVKGIEVHQALKKFRKEFFGALPSLKYIAFVFDIIRFTISEYIFLGIVLMLYKFTTDCESEPIPDNYVVMYQLAVTASTIGKLPS